VCVVFVVECVRRMTVSLTVSGEFGARFVARISCACANTSISMSERGKHSAVRMFDFLKWCSEFALTVCLLRSERDVGKFVLNSLRTF